MSMREEGVQSYLARIYFEEARRAARIAVKRMEMQMLVTESQIRRAGKGRKPRSQQEIIDHLNAMNDQLKAGSEADSRPQLTLINGGKHGS